jgi:hypothetical protein
MGDKSPKAKDKARKQDQAAKNKRNSGKMPAAVPVEPAKRNK